MGLLRRGPDRHAVVGSAQLGKNAATFDRMGGAAMLPELLVEDMGSLAEGAFDIAVSHLVGGGDIAVELTADRRSVRPRRLAAVGHAGQNVIVDREQGRG